MHIPMINLIINPRRIALLTSITIVFLVFAVGISLADNSGNVDTIVDGCMQDVYNKFGQGSPTNLLNCTANDVSLATATNIVILDDGCQFPGDTVDFQANFAVDVTSAERNDVGIYFALDGDPNIDGALKGSCSISTLPYGPSGTWLDLDMTNDNTTSSNDFGYCSKDAGITIAFPITPCDGGSQAGGDAQCVAALGAGSTCQEFGKGITTTEYQDTCGDIQKPSYSPLYPIITLYDVVCIDYNSDGKLDLPYCTSWRQGGANELCLTPLAAYPGTTAKCNCDKSYSVPIRVPGQIIVDKVTVPSGESTSFNFSLDKDITNIKTFSLTDTDPPEASVNLDAGTYKVTETIPAGWSLSASCKNDNGTPANPLDDVTAAYTNGSNLVLDSGHTITCTFTNTWQKTSPTVTTYIHADDDHLTSVTSVPAGTTVHDQATVTGSTYTPSGDVIFYFYNTNNQCNGTPAFTSGIYTLDNGSVDAITFPQGPLGAGSYAFKAHYNGDSYFNAADSACEPLTVTKRQPILVTTPDPTSAVLGTTLYDSAALSGAYNPTGSITFKLFNPNDATCSLTPAYQETITVSGNGSYYTTTGFASNLVGTWRWTADYSGDNNNLTASSGCQAELVTINKAQPTISTTAVSPVTVGANIHDTATIGGLVNPTSLAKITFTLYSDDECTTQVFSGLSAFVNANGDYASPDFTTVNAGNFYWVASFPGDANNLPVATACGDAGETSVVNKDSPSLVTYQLPPQAVLGDILNDSALLSSGYNPTGTITFKLFDPTQVNCTGEPKFTQIVDVDGNGTYGTSVGLIANMVGVWNWTADYSGDDNNNPASSGCGLEPVTITPPIAVTNSSLCDFGDTFRNIFSMDPKMIPWYKDTATNPGQFYYNLSVSGDPGELVEVRLSIPWPFVTQGARPVHVYDGVTLVEDETNPGYYCFEPGNEEAAIDNYIVLSDYGVASNTSGYENGVSDYSVDVILSITIPDTGFAYINQHMDYGLKGLDTDFNGDGVADPQHYVKDANDDALLPDYAHPPYATVPPVVLIPELAEHPFCTFEDTTLLGCDSAYKDNEWKFNPGTSGMVLEIFWDEQDEKTYEEPIEGALVQLINKRGDVVGQDYSDQDGWYQIVYKHIGRPANYTFKATWDGIVFERVVQLQGNEFEEVNVYLDSTGGGVADYVHIAEAISSSKVTKTWNANVKVKVADQDGLIVANAQVSGLWSGYVSVPGICITDITGYCTVTLSRLPLSIQAVTFTVTDIAANGYLYDPAANYGGGVYTVLQIP